MTEELHNIVTVQATLTRREMLRYTPAGIPVVDALLTHQSLQTEAGHARQVEFELPARFAAEQAERIARVDLGAAIDATGFLAPRRKGSRGLQLHITRFSVSDRSGH
ncbi:MAG: primosomal replication protein [Pseudomonadota bacterium]